MEELRHILSLEPVVEDLILDRRLGMVCFGGMEL